MFSKDVRTKRIRTRASRQLEAQQYSASSASGCSSRECGISPAAIEQLKQLAELKTSGVLTDQEFEEQKRKLLGTS